jgi:DNA helicase II / ATP-dependent DNA helicase PcrA
MGNFSFLEELNEAQRAACEQTEGPVMILAGAGSGKTRVLTYRIAHLMKKGVDPFNILSLTFTNKAAREMKNRIAKIVGEGDSKALWMGTFHSIFSRMLRFEAELLGYPKNFTIYDTDDSKSLIREILKQYQLDDKVYKPGLVLSRISSAKNNLISAQKYMSNPVAMEEDKIARMPLMGQIFLTYQKRLFKAGAMDFDDLLFNTNVLLRDFPAVLHKYQDKFRYILVDEYQDTNFSQYVIVRQLAARFQNICVVGDDAQSIYSFRGANIQNILNFEKDYPDLATFKLEQNYRSTQNIVQAANLVISNNKDQFKKNVWTQNETGEKITVVRTHTDNEEGQKTAASIFQIKNNNRARASEFAILYRTNAQSRALEEALRKMNIPYRIYGGLSFYQRKEIKDLLAYFRLAINNNDDESLRRIINYPARGIGQATLDKMTIAANDNDISIFTVMDNLKEFNLGINAGTATKIIEFSNLIKTFSQMLPYRDAFDMGNHIAGATGILKDLHVDKTPEGVSRYENIQELLNGMQDFVNNTRSPQDEELKETVVDALAEPNPSDLFDASQITTDKKKVKTLDEFMMDVALLTDADKDKEDDKNADKVSLMTIHAAKGLEFPYVFIVGMEENLFPSQLALQSRTELEEERRLFYVALTRAEKKATLSYAGVRYRYGKVTYSEPSRFLDELDERFVEFPEEEKSALFSDDTFENFKTDYGTPKKNSGFKYEKPQHKASGLPPINLINKKSVNLIKPKSSAPPISIDVEAIRNLRPEMMVEHDKFGQGKVLKIEGEFPDLKAVIQFGTAGQKMLLLRFARIRVIG